MCSDIVGQLSAHDNLSFGFFYSFKVIQYSKHQYHMTYDRKVICMFVILPHKPHFQAET